jgi:type 1 glutamine amidotransferase
MIKRFGLLLIFMTCVAFAVFSQTAQKKQPRFSVLALYENGGHHILFSQRAKIWLDKLAADSNFFVEYITSTRNITDTFLNRFQLFLQLDYVPYGWSDTARQAFQQYMAEKSHGWLGFHHASLLGEFDGYPIWDWFSNFMGGIKWKDYIPSFAEATVHVEEPSHPCMKGIPSSFVIKKDEWYTYDKSPRPNVHVIASVDESSYIPFSAIKMGDHPVIWSNERFPARNLYIFMGHSPDLFDNPAYTTLFKNAIFWTAHQ